METSMPEVIIKREREAKPELIKCTCGGTYHQVYAVFGLMWECDWCGEVINSVEEAKAKDDLPLLVCS